MTALQDHPVHGPYASMDDALADAMHVYQAARANRESVTMQQILAGLELATLREAHVELGDFDRQIAGWLSSWEPETVEVILGWVERAALANHCVLLAEVVRHRAVIAETGLVMVRCCAHGCPNTAALQPGSSYLCPSHGDGGCSTSNKIKRDDHDHH